jgi:hypothetical protein
VQAVWGAQRQHQQRTAAVPVHVVAAADLGGTAVWNADLALPAAAASWTSNSSSGGSSSSCLVLLLNVWSTAAAEVCTSAAAFSDALIGCAVVDLSVLPPLREQHGWWHIVGSGEQQQGQLKASVRPNSPLLEQLCSQAVAAVSGSAHSIASPPAPTAFAAESPLQQQQQHLQRQEQHDLVQQLQVQLRELELLSQRLAAEPPAAAPAAAATAAVVLAGAEELPASEDEGLAPFDARQVCAACPPFIPSFQQPHLGCTVRTSCASEPPYVYGCVPTLSLAPLPCVAAAVAVRLRLERQRQWRRR